MITGISHHRYSKQFATCGESTMLWDTGRNLPLQEFDWGVDTVHSVKFNPIEADLLAACASDRSIILYDVRASNPMRKVVMDLKTNNVAWNPMEATIFLAANEVKIIFHCTVHLNLNVQQFCSRQKMFQQPTMLHRIPDIQIQNPFEF